MSPVTVRTRFAPSPTGQLHLGGIRTALFVWAFARHHRGTMILRIEDTDRVQPGAVEGILESLQWLGLDYDEGPIHQSQRMARYREVLERMLAEGLAYQCYMPQAELDALREAQMARGEKPRYDGRWRPENVAAQGLVPPPDVAPVIRFKNPLEGTVAWDDAVKGRVEFANGELDDLVIARADWTPTYNFCVVVDDLDMAITHVVRGDDHVNNTPRQINIMRALGGDPPVYAHVPTVLGEDGQKMSKRRGALPVMDYAQQGYLPEAILNFLARLGWSHGDDEIISRAQLVEWFDLGHISHAASRFNAEKLKWVNQEHMKRMPPAELGERLTPFLVQAGLDPNVGPDPAAVAVLLRERTATLLEMAAAARYFYRSPDVPAATTTPFLTPANRPALIELHGGFATLPWTREDLAAYIKAAATRHGLKAGEVMMPLRMLVAGTPATPAIDAVLALLGREVARARMAAGLEL